jgi:AcrR family transcriptional regulator
VVPRLEAADRKQAIVESVRRIFAEKGLDGVTTRELAEAAGVSEGLLYKHFPSKQSLFAAIQHSCCSKAGLPDAPPSTETLVAECRRLFGWAVTSGDRPQDSDMARMFVRSMAGDGEFAREFLESRLAPRVEFMEKCLAAAEKEGNLVSKSSHRELRVWLVQLLAAQLMAAVVPCRAVAPVLKEGRLAEEAALFALRAMGLKEAAIRKHWEARK